MPRRSRGGVSSRTRSRSIVRNYDQMRTLRNANAQPSREVYKAAVSETPEVESHSLGFLNIKCSNCNAAHFLSEKTGTANSAFSLCCEKGKFKLEPYRIHPVIQSLLEGSHPESSNYKTHIRKFNSSLAMASTGLNRVSEGGHGPYFMKIHGTIYHSISNLVAEDHSSASYAQLYFFDVEEAIQCRLAKSANQGVSSSLMAELSHIIASVNRYASSFMSMKEIYQSDPNRYRDMSMCIFKDTEQDQRRYNAPTAFSMHDVAVVFESSDGCPPADRHLIIRPHSAGSAFQTINLFNRSLDPLCYPLLFPFGDNGWHIHFKASNSYKATLNKYVAYRLGLRETFSILHRSEKLFLQWIVDMYVRVEGGRLNYIQTHQDNLRRDAYHNVRDYLHTRAESEGQRVGRMVILPSSFSGSPRNMRERCQDALCMVQHYGKPDLFITFTCNPKWEEITTQLAPGEYAHFRPDLLARVFHAKLKSLIDDLMKKKVFGTPAAIVYTIEFQKRGLPHAHILLSLEGEDKIRDIEDIDQYVCAEIPPISDPLYDLVRRHMIHGPCGTLGQNAPCINAEGKCIKDFPKAFSEISKQNPSGYPLYRRRNNGNNIEIGVVSVDNRFVVPYNKYLLKKYNAHINVEVCTTVKSIKYIYKYIYKGYDACTLAINENNALQYDEITSFVNTRYVGSVEAAWRIFEFEMHFQSHSVFKLESHLPNMQTVHFREGNEESAVDNPKDSKLMAWFKLNEADETARQFLYTEIPQHFVWIDSSKSWRKRCRGGDNVLTRLYTVNPKDCELFHLRILLLHVKGATCFEDLRTFNSQLYPSFQAAAIARGLTKSDIHLREALRDACETKPARQVRHVFALICALMHPSDPQNLWSEFRDSMLEDYLLSHEVAEAERLALIDIDDVLITHNTDCRRANLPVPTRPPTESVEYINVQASHDLFNQLYSSATTSQKEIIDAVLSQLGQVSDSDKMFYLDAPAGCGKTYIQKTIVAYMRANRRNVLITAYTGIAASLIDGGRTLHNIFKLPIGLHESSVPNVTACSQHGQRLIKAELIIIDEASMVPSLALIIIDRLLRDLTRTDLPFGGKVLFMCGDFRQTLPVIPHSNRSMAVESCLKWNPLWPRVKTFRLHQNMRVNEGQDQFSSYLLDVGNGRLEAPPNSPIFTALLPPILKGEGSVIDFVYGNIQSIINLDDITESAILAPKNDDCAHINDVVMCLLPGESKTYLSIDTILSDDIQEVADFPTEFLNSFEISGLPRHNLTLKINSIVILMRNLNTARGIINGTRMQVLEMGRHLLNCRILTGASKGESILIPRIKLCPSKENIPFDMERIQFPVALAFCMTFNKAQGQSLKKVGIYLPTPVFSHGQLYVAMSRSRTFDGVKIFLTPTKDQTIGAHGEIITKNIVYHEVLSDSIPLPFYPRD